MEFNIGKVFIKVSMQKWITVIAPIGSHMVAAKIELFEMRPSNSVSVGVEVYHKDDVTVVDKVQRWMEE
jgi:hypothetical protein